MGTKQTIYRTDNTTVTNISATKCIWTYAEWECFVHLKSLTPFITRWIKSKGHPVTCQHRHRREAQVQLQPLRNPTLEVDGWSISLSGSCTRAWVGVRVGLDGKENFTPQVGFELPTVQPVVISYTDWAMPVAIYKIIYIKGRDSSGGTATRYGLDGPGSNPRGGKIFRNRPDRPWGTPSLLYNGYRVFPGSKAAGVWCWPNTHI